MATATAWNWRPVQGFLMARKVQDRIGRVLDSWEDTPYRPGQQQKGVGVDCVRFVCGVLDELYGFPRTEIPNLPADVALHARGTAQAALRKIMRLYGTADPLQGVDIEPGDIFIAAAPGGGPGHAMIVGARRNEIWHSTGSRVQRAGIGIFEIPQTIWVLDSVYRMNDREKWAHGP